MCLSFGFNENFNVIYRAVTTGNVSAQRKLVTTQREVLSEYGRLAAEAELNPSQKNIAAMNSARATFEAATHRYAAIDIIENKVTISSRKADADSIITPLERFAPGSTQQGQSALDIKA